MKSSKAEAHYIAHSPRNHCRDCAMFRPPHGCTAVEGTISPDGHCKYFKEKSMSDLTAKRRDKLPKSDFGEPGERKYPMPDRSHAANAKARAAQMLARGLLSRDEKEKIDAKANRILGEK